MSREFKKLTKEEMHKTTIEQRPVSDLFKKGFLLELEASVGVKGIEPDSRAKRQSRVMYRLRFFLSFGVWKDTCFKISGTLPHVAMIFKETDTLRESLHLKTRI